MRLSYFFYGKGSSVILFSSILLPLSSCKSDNEKPPSNNTSKPTANITNGSLPQKWLKKWNHLSSSQEKSKESKAALLQEAQQTFTAHDFAYLLEKVTDDTDLETLGFLHTQLANMVLKQGPKKLPKWYRDLQSEELKESIAYAMGQAVAKEQPTERDAILQRFQEKDQKQEKIRFMLGYSMATVKSNPNETFNAYLAWGVKNGGLEPFPTLIAQLPDNTDFAACDQKIPRSQAHIALNSRNAIYKRWEQMDVVKLINHLTETERYGDHLHTALQAWGLQNLEALDSWMAQIELSGYQNPAWDAVKRIRTENLMAKQPAEAKQHVFEIKDDRQRIILWLKVYAIWIKTDYDAAYAARMDYGRRYPSKPKTQPNP